jgi:hypothetical protein
LPENEDLRRIDPDICKANSSLLLSCNVKDVAPGRSADLGESRQLRLRLKESEKWFGLGLVEIGGNAIKKNLFSDY